MGSIVFVHDSGVRRESYQRTFGVVQDQLDKRAPGWNLVECLWGEECGVRLHLKGKSIPRYMGAAADTESDELMRWWALYHDPYYELRNLAVETGETKKAPLGQAPTWLALKSNIEQYNPSAKLKQLLVASHLDGFWSQAFHQLIQSHEFADALQTAGAALGAFRRTVARAVFAQMNALAHNQGWSAVDGETRDRIVNCLVGELGGDDKAIGEIGRMALG